jgi:hypothetical protein
VRGDAVINNLYGASTVSINAQGRGPLADALTVTNNSPLAEMTGQALSNVTGADINLSSLLSDPTGFTQLFGALQRTYGHLVDIAPAEIDPSLTVLQGLWGSLATVDPRSAEAESVVARAIASPEVQDANDAVASWITANCSAN